MVSLPHAPFPVTAGSDADALISELSKMSIQERNRVQEEFHGVLDLPDETYSFLQQRLQLLEQEIHKIQEKTAYEIAEGQGFEYVHNAAFRLQFLRAECFDAALAANRLTAFFQMKLECFGEKTLGRPITLNDMNRDDMAAIKGGKFQVLRARDSVGRIVCCNFQLSEDVPYKTTSMIKAAIYMFCCVAEDLETSRKGAVCLNYFVGDFRLPMNRDLHKGFSRMFQVIPIRATAIHFCCTHEFNRLFFATTMAIFKSRYVRRSKAHAASTHTESKYCLMTYGIPVRHLPVSEHGQLKTQNHLKWLQRRRIQEAALENTGHFSGIELPMLGDVLGGRGKPMREYPGNLQMKALVEEYLIEYKNSNKKGKVKIMERIVESVEESGGRFLEQRDDGFWEVMANDKAKQRVSICFRNMRATKLRNKTTQIIESQERPARTSLPMQCLRPTATGGACN